MELLEPLRSLNELPQSSELAVHVAGVTLHALFQMIFQDGFVHADMHPGNLLLLPDNSLAVLDLGFVAELNLAEKRNFASFFFGMVCNKGRECSRVLYETASSHAPGFRREAFDADVVELVDRHFARTAREFDVTAFAAQLFQTMAKHGLRGSTRFVTTILSLVVFEGIAKRIDPALDFQAEARRYLPLVLRTLLGPQPARAEVQHA